MLPEPMDRTIMRCCGKLVMVEYEEHGYAVYATWTCVLCQAHASHCIGEIDATRAVAHGFTTTKPMLSRKG